MTQILEYKQELLDLVKKHHEKYELSKTTDDFAYDPGKTDNLSHYYGVFDEASSTITISTEVKGLRYEERSKHLDNVNVGDKVIIKRDPNNPFNSNNFEIFTTADESLGTLSADLCNKLAPLYDLGYALIDDACAVYIEKFEDRSRYVKQGLLFVKIRIRLIGIN